MAERIGVSLHDYHRSLQDATQCQVLSISARDDDGEDMDPVSTQDTPLGEIERSEFRRELAAAISALPEREKLVLSMYYDDELNLREIGAVLEVSESRVCQIHGQALLRLRARLGDWKSTAAAA